jgi:AcrR family transcriptional regulator
MMKPMATTAHRSPRRTPALSRDVIVQAAIDLLDAEGEHSLTLKALTVRLSTGYGAIYHHVADRDDLLAAATDHVIAHVVTGPVADAEPRQVLRALALGLFDAIYAHPWAGAQLTREPWRPALLDIYESIAAQLRALGVPDGALSDSAGVLVNYIFGVAVQNAANARALAESKMDRSEFLADVAARWAQLDPARYPSMRKARTHLREHDDREQFLTGIDLILAGIETVNRVGKDNPAR